MFHFTKLALVLVFYLVGFSLAVPFPDRFHKSAWKAVASRYHRFRGHTIVRPGGVENVRIGMDNCLNARPSPVSQDPASSSTPSSIPASTSLANTFDAIIPAASTSTTSTTPAGAGSTSQLSLSATTSACTTTASSCTVSTLTTTTWRTTTSFITPSAISQSSLLAASSPAIASSPPASIPSTSQSTPLAAVSATTASSSSESISSASQSSLLAASSTIITSSTAASISSASQSSLLADSSTIIASSSAASISSASESSLLAASSTTIASSSAASISPSSASPSSSSPASASPSSTSPASQLSSAAATSAASTSSASQPSLLPIISVQLSLTLGAAPTSTLEASTSTTSTAAASTSTTSSAAASTLITSTSTTSTSPASQPSVVAGQLPLALVNNLAGTVNAYVTGLDANGQLVMLQPDGTFYYPVCTSDQTTPLLITANVAIPLGAQGSTTYVTIPSYISAARVWFAADGDLQFFVIWNPATNAPSLIQPSSVNPADPSADVNWGFVELTFIADAGLYANISYVDFVGLPLGIELAVTDGTGSQSALGLPANAVDSICGALDAQSQIDGEDWDRLCLADSSGRLLRVIAPTQYLSVNATAFSTLWTAYVDSVWTQYSTQTLSIDTQMSAGVVDCTVAADDNMYCTGSSRAFAKPTAMDIFGCNSGPFYIQAGDNNVHNAIVPRLCAAFDRTTLLLPGGNVQPSLPAANYYTEAPTNWYSKAVHQFEVDGKGYAFSYDDVAPSGGADQSGTVASRNPALLTIIVGGP